MMLNKTVLMSGADYFNDGFAINPYMDASVAIDVPRAVREHAAIRQALEEAGIEVIQVPPPENCQDGVYAANWALCRGDTVVLASLPNARVKETPYAKGVLKNLGKKVVEIPEGLRFSGQGDALPCRDYLFAGSEYRTDKAVHQFLSDTLGYNVISLQTVPEYDNNTLPAINHVTGWPDSFFYDIDLALGVIRDDLIAWCPEAFTPESQELLRKLGGLEKIEVSLEEAMQGFACNLVSTGEVVIMSANAPQLRLELESRGIRTITPEIHELAKGGGFIRCTTLTLDN
jgi:N-dimethylarginine dimethylaminohydrolase